MDTLQFEMEAVPVRTLALPELLECYLRARNNDPYKNPLDKRDENHADRGFDLLGKFFASKEIVAPDSSHVDAKALKDFQVFLIQQTGRGGQLFSRTYCNTLVKAVKSAFFWALTQEPPIITEARALALSKVAELKPSPKIRENKKRTKAPVEHFESLFPLLRPEVSAMFRLQFLHAMRSGEVCNIRPSMINFDYDEHGNWLYQPEKHKTAGRGKERTFVFWKESQEILKPHLQSNADPDEPIFRNLKGRPFSVCVYDSIIRKTIEKHGLKKIVPYQSRHTTATRVKQEFGIEHARALLGHTTEHMTRHYIHEDEELIQQIAVERNRKHTTHADPPPVTLRLYRG